MLASFYYYCLVQTSNLFEFVFQQDGRLCAQHCLNAALQGPYFSAVDLAELALRLDEDERLQMAENGIDSPEYQRFIAQPSGNMDDTGYFSVQVISRALSLWNLELIPLNSSEPLARQCRIDPTQVNAYIFHMENHWFCIRRFKDIWFNLNSMFSKPKYMSSLYLTEYLKQMEQEGYMVFIVSGSLPECAADRKPPVPTKLQQSEGRRLDSTSANQASSVVSSSDLETALKLSLECFGDDDTVVSINAATPTAEEIRARRLAFFTNKPSNEK